MGVTSMAQLIIGAIAIIAVVLMVTYAYSFLHYLLTITKCPDCGRIMQRVVYTELADERNKKVVNECCFCHDKRIRKGSVPQYSKRTLYP